MSHWYLPLFNDSSKNLTQRFNVRLYFLILSIVACYILRSYSMLFTVARLLASRRALMTFSFADFLFHFFFIKWFRMYFVIFSVVIFKSILRISFAVTFFALFTFAFSFFFFDIFLE